MKIAILIGLLTCFSLPLVAQEKTAVEPVVTEEKKTEPKVEKYDPSGKKEYKAALLAKEKGDLKKALTLLEKASFKENNALYLFEYAKLLDLMGETTQAIRVLDRNAVAMKAHPEISTYSLVYQKLQNKRDAANTVESPSLVGPIVTIAGAATTIAGVVFIVLSQGTKSDGYCSTSVSPRLHSCDNPIQRTKQEAGKILDSSDSQLLVGSILTGVGIGATALGTVLWLSDDTKVSTTLNPLNKNYSVNVSLRF